MGKNSNTSFLAIDVGQSNVRGLAFVKRNGRSTYFTHTENGGTIKQNIINTIDVIEEKLDVKCKNVFITGNFGIVDTTTHFGHIDFPHPKIIGTDDVYNAIFKAESIKNTAGQLLHLIPLNFMFDNTMTSNTINIKATRFDTTFNAITYAPDIIDEIKDALTSACIPPAGFFDPIYILGRAYHKNNNPTILIDFGKTKTSVGVIKNGALSNRFDLTPGQDEVTKRIEEDFGITYMDAEEIKKSVSKTPPVDADEYISASPKYKSLTRSDVWGAWFEVNTGIVERIMDSLIIDDSDIYIMGSELNAENIKNLILRNKGLDCVIILTEYAAAAAVLKINTEDVAAGSTKKNSYATALQHKHIPIIPGIMEWNINNSNTYKMFQSVGIKKIHIDIMDGFYTRKVSGGLEELALVRGNTNMILHTHLMVDDNVAWVKQVLEIGVEIILLSTGTHGLLEALKIIKLAGRQAGLAIHPDFDLKKLTPRILTMLDEVMIMSVVPGASGQSFLESTPMRIRTMANTRDTYGFNYKITVDGGINDKTAPLCWAAGADFLVSASYLKNAPDFADALASLLRKS